MKLFLAVTIFIFSLTAVAAPPKKNVKSKFYDFNDQVIDGEIRKPTALYTSAREKAKFERLLQLKKSFLPQLFKTAREKVFK